MINCNTRNQMRSHSQKVAETIKEIAKSYDLNWEQAERVVKLGINSNFNETITEGLGDLNGALTGISRAFV